MSRRSPRRWLAMAAPLSALVLVLAACVEDARPATCDQPAVTIQLALGEASLDPADPAVCRDQAVTLVVASSVDGIFHVHGYDDAVGAAVVSAGETLRLEFTAIRAGQFPIELHPTVDPTGIDIGVLTVHER